MINRLLERHSGQRHIVRALRENRNIIKAAALLHDLGHGPFSHVYERVFSDTNQPKHERWSCDIIADASTEINERLRAHKIPVGQVLGLIWGGTSKLYSAGKRPEPFLKDIVSSQLDADRMDFLLRDSASTGSKYGCFDQEWILNSLAIGEVLAPRGRLKKLCLDRSKGMGAIQEFLIARMLMTHHVYGHKTTRAYESELLMTLRLAAKLCDKLPSDTPSAVVSMLSKKGKVTVKEYLLLDDEIASWALRRWAAWQPLKGKSESPNMLALKRHALKIVRRQQPWQTVEILSEENFAAATLLVRDLRESDNPLYFECSIDDGNFLPYKNLLFRTQDVRSEGDEEELFYRTLDGIYLIDRHGNTVSLEKSGSDPILEALAKQTVRYRFYFDRAKKKTFTKLLKNCGVVLG